MSRLVTPKLPLALAAVVIGLITLVTFIQMRRSPQHRESMQVVAAETQVPYSTTGRSSGLPDAPMATSRLQGRDVVASVDGSVGQGSRSNHDAIVMLENRLRAEKIDPSWAAANEQAIGKAIVGSEHDGFDVLPPDALEASCRSSLCSIRMTYADEEQAMQMQTKLTLGLPAAISVARTFFVPRQDGVTEILVFAGNRNNLF